MTRLNTNILLTNAEPKTWQIRVKDGDKFIEVNFMSSKGWAELFAPNTWHFLAVVLPADAKPSEAVSYMALDQAALLINKIKVGVIREGILNFDVPIQFVGGEGFELEMQATRQLEIVDIAPPREN